MLLPLGTRALRAGLASAFVVAALGVLAFDVARALSDVVVPRVTKQLGKGATPASLLSAACAVAVLAALLAPVFQTEATAPGGAVTGALLVMLSLRLASKDAGASPIALVLGLALSYDPVVFVAAAGAAAPFARRVPSDRRMHALASFAIGLLPLALPPALAWRAPDLVLAAPVVERSHARLVPFVMNEVGLLSAAAFGGGLVLAAAVPEARKLTASLLFVVAGGAIAIHSGAPVGPARVGPAVLAAVLAMYVLASVALACVVLAVARAPVPFAQASAALIVVLELVLPIRSLDESLTRLAARAPRAATAWNDVAWGSLPPAAVLLANDATTWRRISAARAVGEMRGDLVIVPAFDLAGRAARRALGAEPKLAPLYRDVALGTAPEELSFAQLTGQRAVAAVFDPMWDRALARHFVPLGLTSRLEGEPRGASDRRRALDAFTPAKDRLVRFTVARRDPDLVDVTASLLRARAVGIAAAGERDVLARALDDLRAFAPDDAVSKLLVRRIVTSKGPIEVRDLPR
jgi:hypothetical protein